MSPHKSNGNLCGSSIGELSSLIGFCLEDPLMRRLESGKTLRVIFDFIEDYFKLYISNAVTKFRETALTRAARYRNRDAIAIASLLFRSFVARVSRDWIDMYAPLRAGALRGPPLSRNEHNWHRQDDLTCVLIIP